MLTTSAPPSTGRVVMVRRCPATSCTGPPGQGRCGSWGLAGPAAGSGCAPCAARLAQPGDARSWSACVPWEKLSRATSIPASSSRSSSSGLSLAGPMVATILALRIRPSFRARRHPSGQRPSDSMCPRRTPAERPALPAPRPPGAAGSPAPRPPVDHRGQAEGHVREAVGASIRLDTVSTVRWSRRMASTMREQAGADGVVGGALALDDAVRRRASARRSSPGALVQSAPVVAQYSARRIPAMFSDHTGTSLSPCSPMM